MRFLISTAAAILLTAYVSASSLSVVSEDNVPSAPLPASGAAVDEVVVHSSLYIKPKANLRPQVRRVRSLPFAMPLNSVSLLEHVRVKRMPQYKRFGPQYGQSQANAAADANSIQFGPQGASSAASNAGSQAFNAFGPNGSFGASSAGTLTQASQSGLFGSSNSAGASMSQVFRLPNGQVINFASTNSFSNAPNGNNANSRGSSVSVGQA
ncbi:uncharacterized protein LOC101457601 [Ceratitis capitata]|uniref:(Mediterranean fruit fly) hypothetical protein n=1 Tax=Ceratitis capitata TaxID=7213 RepID=A0A811V4D6_CERCA|nr:uncharacterized protein LOC101457601 [Ceratitis capitata]CAD7005235.1 unnamed protein product [Ceratitis capitata]